MNAPASRPQWPAQSPEPGSEAQANATRPWLSALADGDVASVEQACDAWRHDAQARADWHTYHLIGDVLRSEDLAGDPARDAQFLARLRVRLAAEPVPLAPEAASVAVVPRRRRSVWLVPVAAAAGVAAVAGVLVLGQADPPGAVPATGWASNSPATDRQGLLATEATQQRVANAGLGSPGTNGATTGNANARVLRDARLDHYLEAHRGALGVAVAVPGGAMRNAEVIVPAPEQR